MNQMQARVDLDCSERKVFACLPSKHRTVCLLQPVIEEIQLRGVFLEEEILLHQLDEHYIAGPDDRDRHPCRWMTVCSLLGISTLHRTDNRSLTAISPIAWAFFKNAFAMYAELVARGPAISSCEALLVMALFMLRTADAGLAAQLTAAAAHMAHMLGLQKQEYYVGLDAEVAERHKRILWAVYILNADVTHRYGIPSPLDEESIVIELPEVEHCHVFSPGDHTARLARQHRGGILRQQAFFAVTQLRIHKLLERVSSRRLSMQESTDLLEAVTKIHQELEEWKCFLPTETQPSSRLYGTPRLEMSVAILHYTYLSCISKISMTAAVLLDLTTLNPDMQEVQSSISNKIFATSRMARARCAMAARGTLDVLLRLKPQPFTHLWQTLCFPLSAILVLLSETLAYPASAHAETDVELIHDFVQYLERLKSEGCEVHRLLDGCRRIWSIATCALIASQTDQKVTVFEQTRESICSKFAQVVDWLQLAEGLLSNVPMLTSKARKFFCDILELGELDENYGDFAPKILKSSNYGFSFSN
ncbi:hypothetical protein COCVIDRAFT_40717 [Bipolaris victoriae FI3]|uniref:Xylanolytic transcriptional activator regulatory domain-containing protein n=1 Tax=Bipolaris victoriae (strain FI3) TaxID=930091 RepID=W7E048_BIPV3|nr:hypothetical protein COCVIDRAFT_40717 [Bipolaris victoriae FI3]